VSHLGTIASGPEYLLIRVALQNVRAQHYSSQSATTTELKTRPRRRLSGKAIQVSHALSWNDDAEAIVRSSQPRTWAAATAKLHHGEID